MRTLLLLFLSIKFILSVNAQCSFTASLSINPSCYSICNGSATINVSGGTPPFTLYYDSYPVATFTGSYFIDSLCLADYVLVIEDASGCSEYLNISVDHPSNLSGTTVTPSVIHESCPGNYDGEVSVSISGSTGPYSSILLDTVTGSMINTLASPADNLGPYAYIIEVMNSLNQCSLFPATVNPGLASNCGTIIGQYFYDENNNCLFDGTDFNFGSAYNDFFTLMPTGHTIDLNADGTFTRSVPLGNYTLNTNVYTNPCLPTSLNFTFGGQVINLQVGDPISNNTCGLSLSATITNSCFGFCNGGVAINAVGGTPPYSYSLYGADSLGSASNLCPGNHVAVVHDATGCYESILFTIDSSNVDTSLTISATILPQSCPVGPPDGSVSLALSGVNSPYNVLWTHDASTSTSITGLVAGSYSATITSAAGTCNYESYTVPLSPSSTCPGISGFNYFDLNNNCVFDSTDHPAIFMVFVTLDSLTGPPFSYYANPYSDTSGFFYCNLPYGNYTVTPYMPIYPGLEMNCDTIYYGNLSSTNTSDTGLNFSLQDNDFCGDTFNYELISNCANGLIDLNSLEGSLVELAVMDPYYSSVGYNTIELQPDFDYLILAVDTSGCSELIEIHTPVLGQMEDSLFNFGINNESCWLGFDGNITVNYSGTDPLHYIWTTNDTTNSIANLSQGNYDLHLSNTLTGECKTFSFYVDSDSACGTVIGQVFFDVNGNCTYEPTIDHTDFSTCFNYVMLNSWDYILTDSTGWFQFEAATGSFNLEYLSPYCSDSTLIFASPCWNYATATIDSIGSISDTVFFPLDVSGDPNVTVSCYGFGAVPGFEMFFQVFYENMSNVPIDGQLFCVLDDTLTLSSWSIAPDFISGDTLFWNLYGLIYSGGFNNLTISATLPPDPGLLGSSIVNSCGFIASGPEAITGNNFCTSSTTVVGSYDPNNKLVHPTGVGPLGYIKHADSLLTYIINFQNTGTAPAHNIVIKDTISSHLDISSLIVTDASHMYTYTVNGNVVEFEFPSIMLPDSTSNEPGSHGFIKYEIHVNPELPEMTMIENTAYIYFDFNPPIVTNTTLNTINNFVSVNESKVESKVGFKAYPNPFNQFFILQPDNVQEPYDIDIIDIAGKNVLTFANKKGLTKINTSSLMPGCYLVRMESDSGTKSLKLIKQ